MLSGRAYCFWVLLAVFAVVGQLSAPVSVAAKNGGLVGVEGVLTSVDPAAGNVVIRSRRGQSVTIVTNSATKIERNSRHSTLAAFRVGDRVEAKFATATSTVALKVEAVGP